ncbi:hypothetical protein BKN37_26470 [Mycobacterium talmoniae]|uniref:DUF4328 domain-containing protein n=1 Tax=Mycobacterium talmoniae TaxID=1858794 RepID=A0A1S1MMI6_9MYCO|nr:hypothetical protein BKN37_26470 [Mycobacterium talmoniae]
MVDPVRDAGAPEEAAPRRGPSAALVRATLLATTLALGLAVLAHVVRYVLLIINRNTLLHPLVAGAGLWLGILASVAATLLTIGAAVVLTRWLIARRAAAFAHHGHPDPRANWAVRLGCLAPPVYALVTARVIAIIFAIPDDPPSRWLLILALLACLLPLLATVWALVYLVELAKTEDHYARLRQPIWVWWLAALLGTATSAFATLTSFARDAQGIANNTVAMTLAYLLTLVATVAVARVFEGFERRPVERPVHRWVVVADAAPAPDISEPGAPGESLESEQQEPAA